MIVLAKPDPSDMVQAIKKAISILPNIDPQIMHNRVSLQISKWYSFWESQADCFSISVIFLDEGTLQLA